MQLTLDGRAALITGGSKGLGLAMAKAFTEAGGHVAIVARSMGLPMVASLEGIADNARAGDLIAVDGEMGEAHLRPAPEIVKACEE